MLHLHRSERADALVPPLSEVLAQPLDDPFMADVVVVPARGVQRWLAQQLSRTLGAAPGGHDGVCANVSFWSPGRLTAEVLSAAAGLSVDDDPWRVGALRWTILSVIDECLDEPWASVLGRHLGRLSDGGQEDLREVRSGRRLALAQHLARLFASYGSQRPDMMAAWARGDDIDGTWTPERGPGPVPPDLLWQPELWRRVRERTAVPSPAERLDGAVDALSRGHDLVALPPRLSVFGPTRVPEDQVRILHGLSRHRAVHLWLTHPSPALWAANAAAGSADARTPTPPTAAVPRRGRTGRAANTVLASMSRDLDELQHRLGSLDGVLDEHHPAAPPADTLLGALQRRIRDDDAGTTTPGHVLHPSDVSVQVHACHGRVRQVEVLRELLVGMLEDDPSLEPRDIVVLCPDVEEFAPLVTAAFGEAADDDVHPGHGLRVQLADRSLRQTNPVLSLLTTVLDLADGRVTASEVLDLAGTEPVRRRFGFDDDDLQRLHEWAVACGVHWGEDDGRRARFGLAGLRQGTWDTALDRILLGVTMADEDQRFLGSALPLDDVDGTDVTLAGGLAELIARLTDILGRLTGTRPVQAWLDDLDRVIDLLADVPPSQAWQIGQARLVLADVRASAGDLAPGLRLWDVRALLADRLRGRQARPTFRTGGLTFCSLDPLHAVPHRVVCLLGLDDGTFPRGTSSDGDDLLLREPCPGEHDRRSEDRQRLLDAVASAGDRLIVVYSGADERTGAPRPPAVPVSELLDAVDRTAAAGDRPARDQVVIRHPLQAVDQRNFTRDALGVGVMSFDRAALRAAIAGRGDRDGDRPFLPGPLPLLPRPDEVELDDLVALLEHPVRWFLKQRLQFGLAGDDLEVRDRLPLALEPLVSWAIGDRLLAACLSGADRQRSIAAEWRRGEVPPRELGRTALVTAVDQVEPLAVATWRFGRGPATRVDLRADLPGGTVVTGTVGGVRGDTAVRTVYSRLGAKHRLRAWVQLLALATAYPDRPWRAVTVGRASGRQPSALVSIFTTPDVHRAGQWLEDLVRLRERALREPLPMPVSAAYEYAVQRSGGADPDQALERAAEVWDGGFERRDEYHRFCWGDVPLSALPGGSGVIDAVEQAWWPQERTRFGVLARRVWDVPLRHEEVTRA